MKSYEKQDCVAIRVQFFAKTDKDPIELKLAQPMQRWQASQIADGMNQDPTVFRVECYTDKGMVF